MLRSADAVIMAAGKGERFGERKQFLSLGPETVLKRSVDIFSNMAGVEKIIVVFPSDMEETAVRKQNSLSEEIILVKGAELRMDSVKNGLSRVDSEYLLIHDAVRPLCSRELAEEVLRNAFECDAVVPGLKPASTVKQRTGDTYRTVSRDDLFIIQTPQGFKTQLIKEAYEKHADSSYTDSSSVVEALGKETKIVNGERNNIKITFPEDYLLVKSIIGEKQS